MLAEYFKVDMDYIYTPNELSIRSEEKINGIKRNDGKS